MFAWSIILVSHLAFRKRRPRLAAASMFKTPVGKPMVWVVFAFFAFILWALPTQMDTLIAFALKSLSFAVIGIVYAVMRKNPHHQARIAQWREETAKEAAAFGTAASR